MEYSDVGTGTEIPVGSGFSFINSQSFGDSEQTISNRHDRKIMAICTAASRCGCAIYCESTVYLVADRKDQGDPYKAMEIVIQKTSPDVVVVSGAQKQLITYLEKRFQFQVIDLHRGKAVNDDIIDPAFTLAIVPNSWFCISKGEQKLIDSDWMSVRDLRDPQERSLIVFSKIKKSIDVCAIRSIAAIDMFLLHEFAADARPENQVVASSLNTEENLQVRNIQSQTSQATRTTNEEAKLPENLMPVLNVLYMDPGPVLSIDNNTLLSLNIFPPNRHKNRQAQAIEDPDASPVASLYDVLNQCQSIQGKKMLNTIMMWPLVEIDELHHRHETVDYFLRPENKLFRDQLAIQLKNVVPLTRILSKIVHTVGSYKDLSILYKSLWAFMAIIDLIRANNCSDIAILSRILELDVPGLRQTVDSIINVIDFERSKRGRGVEINDCVDQEVDAKRDVANNLNKFCDEVAIEETAKYSNVLGKRCHVQYIPRVGFMASITFNSMQELETMRVNKEFDLMLATEELVYFKTPRMEELDRDAGDITCDLIDLQERVIIELQTEILQYSETILRLVELCGELDCLLAFAMVSFQRGFIRPDFNTSDDEIDIRNGQHPLQFSRHAIIPNNIRFCKEDSGRKSKIMVITGPNSCGKTTYMKTTCLIIYMAHIGCFVPATYAKIPIVDAILTRMQSANTISTGLSTFATDLNQINYALARATTRSFLAIDEFGKGTQAHDGFHLLKGLVAYLAKRGNACPHVMVATHFNRLVNHLQAYSEYILYKTFKVTRDLKKDSIVYEFKIMDGVSESSLADQVAINAGVPSHIIERARQIRELIVQGRQMLPRPSHAA